MTTLELYRLYLNFPNISHKWDPMIRFLVSQFRKVAFIPGSYQFCEPRSQFSCCAPSDHSRLFIVLPSPNLLCSLHDKSVNLRPRQVLGWGKDFIWEPADWEDGRLAPQNNHLVRAWMSDSFMDQRWGRRWGNKVKRPCNSCKYLLEWPLQSLHGWYEVEYFLSKPQTKMSHLPVIQASPRVNFWAHHKQQTGELGAAVCQTKNSRISQFFTCGQGQMISLQQTIMNACCKSGRRVKLTEADPV